MPAKDIIVADKYTQCPFFKGHGAVEIRCEGPFDGVNVRLMFENKAEKTKQKEIFCHEAYKRCEVYRCVMSNKYPEA